MEKDSGSQNRDKIRSAGVVGAGGGGFPTHVKYDARVDVVIANGAECEPLVRVDQQLMATKPRDLLRGLEIAMQTTGASRGVIALKKKYTPAIEALQEALRLGNAGSKTEIHVLDDFYPAGDEFVVVRDVLGKVIPEFGLPLDVGAVVSNVSTLIDVAQAVDSGRPVTHRHVTVGGDVKEPSSFNVPIGVPASELIAAAGGSNVPDTRIIAGGPMMGSLLSDSQQPVTKTMSMLLVLPSGHPVVLRRERDARRQIHLTRSACLKCMLCTEICPRNLLGHRLFPDRLMRNLAAGVAEDDDAFTGAYLCSECGLCAVYGCVMNLDPCAINREMKQRLSGAGLERPKAEPQPVPRSDEHLRRVPSRRLIARLGVAEYDLPAPLRSFDVKPQKLFVPLSQHVGAPARPVVQAGQKVSQGDLLGEIPDGALGARVHAGLTGVVSQVEDGRVTIEVE